jgi:hypothetical protein
MVTSLVSEHTVTALDISSGDIVRLFAGRVKLRPPMNGRAEEREGYRTLA